MKKAGIIGGSGFIGSYITKKFLEEDYHVKVSSTDISNEEKYKHLKNLKNAENLEIIPLNIEDIDELREFLQDCNIVVHGGTPFQLEFEDPQKELLDPTINGTENFLKVVQENPTIKKVVFIASVGAYNAAFPMPAPDRSPDHIYTEADTPYVDDNCHPYAQAKYYADQTVRKFVKENPNLDFDIVSVFPAFVVGKPLSGRQDSTSVGMQFLLKNKLAPNELVEMLYENDVEFALVDVKDVAESVYRTSIAEDNHGKNYILSSESWKVSDISRMLNNENPQNSPRKVYSGDLATEDLGIEFKPPKIPLSQFDGG